MIMGYFGSFGVYWHLVLGYLAFHVGTHGLFGLIGARRLLWGGSMGTLDPFLPVEPAINETNLPILF